MTTLNNRQVISRALLLSVAILSLAGSAAFGWLAFDRWTLERDWAYVRDTILGDSSVMLWRGDVVILVHADWRGRVDWVRRGVAEYQEILSEFAVSLTVKELVPGAGPQVADTNTIAVVFGPIAAYEELPSSRSSRAIDTTNLSGVTRWFVNDSFGEAVLIFVFVESDDSQQAIFVHEMAHALGMTAGHAPDHADSVLDIRSTATRLAPIDRKALRFLYGYLNYGDGLGQVRAAFDAHWRGVPDD